MLTSSIVSFLVVFLHSNWLEIEPNIMVCITSDMVIRMRSYVKFVVSNIIGTLNTHRLKTHGLVKMDKPFVIV